MRKYYYSKVIYEKVCYNLVVSQKLPLPFYTKMNWTNIKDTIDNYFAVTTIHGFQYVQRSNMKRVRLFWVIDIKHD